MKDKNKTNRQDFLLSFFGDNGYQEKQVNGFWLVKQWNSNANIWQVAIYSQESFKNYKRAHQQFAQNSLNWIK